MAHACSIRSYRQFNAVFINFPYVFQSLPKSVRFEYDLFLHTEDLPPVNHTRVEMLTFTSPAEDFTKKLLQAGGNNFTTRTSNLACSDRKSESPVNIFWLVRFVHFWNTFMAFRRQFISGNVPQLFSLPTDMSQKLHSFVFSVICATPQSSTCVLANFWRLSCK